ncbi:MAG: hypothetical protein DWQ02_19145 [Bacteroidetes bacterium]|nr:MAG: hypothetical protein DWQ02_19145 [Bacteroidota bacterium]
MFDIIVESEIADARERAKQGNYDSMLYLAFCLMKGLHTGMNLDKSMVILDYLLERKKELPFKEIYWDALIFKSEILQAKGECEEVDSLMIEYVESLHQTDPGDWALNQLAWAVDWLRNRKYEEGISFSKE